MDPVFWFVLVALAALVVWCVVVVRRRSGGGAATSAGELRGRQAEAEHLGHVDHMRNPGGPS